MYYIFNKSAQTITQIWNEEYICEKTNKLVSVNKILTSFAPASGSIERMYFIKDLIHLFTHRDKRDMYIIVQN